MNSRLQVRIIGEEVLREEGRPLGFPEDAVFIRELLHDMFRVLADHEGLGLAAPQVGEPVRLFIALPDYLRDLQGHTVFINPVIEPYGEMEKREEGCLSIPGIYETLERPSRAKVRALDENGEEFTLDVNGLSARLVQHETDHLNGILFTDRLSPMKKKLLRRKLRSLREQELYG
jgi:peptide deformylase